MSDLCACKGVRSCSFCSDDNLTRLRVEKNRRPVESLSTRVETMTKSELESIGAFLFEDFLTEAEETALATLMDSGDWIPSQSGRSKQDFGPKANFKRRKAKLGNFKGIPAMMFPLFERLKSCHHELRNYEPVECLFLEYKPEHGAHIDPHFDDTWLWLRVI